MGEMQRESKRRPTRKQRKLIRERLKDPAATLSELGERAGYHDKAKVHRALKAPAVQQTMAEIMAARPDLNRAALAQKLAEGLSATETRFFADKGRVVDKRVVPDYSTREKYLRLAGQFNRDLLPDKGEGAGEVGALVGGLISALQSARAQEALQRTSIPSEAVPSEPAAEEPPIA